MPEQQFKPANKLARDVFITGKERERLHHLCEMASKEPDRAKLVKLVREISDLLEAEEKRRGYDSQSPGANGASEKG